MSGDSQVKGAEPKEKALADRLWMHRTDEVAREMKNAGINIFECWVLIEYEPDGLKRKLLEVFGYIIFQPEFNHEHAKYK